ncbi:MAG TPA: hypothetical protein VIO94_09965 [Phenylobacterium sp.]
MLLAFAQPAHATWYRAETERFIVYGEGREAQVREYAVKLTTFDKVLRFYHPATANRPVGQKVEIFLVEGPSDLRRIRPGLPNGIRGFYVGNNEAVFAAADVSSGAIEAEQVLFHEYAHHFMLENFPSAYPAWFVEGWAEYFMTARITPEKITIGEYNDNRVAWLFGAEWVPLRELLTKRPGELRRDGQALFYSEAWLLMHYMRSDAERAAQLNAATLAISKGEEPVAAFIAATGMQPEALQKKLRKYVKLPIVRMDNAGRAPEVKVTALPASADMFLLENVRLMISSPEPVDEKFLRDVRAKAAKFPGDRLAEMTLARTEFTYGDVAAGEAIMQRLIAANPTDVDVLVLAGVGQFLGGVRKEEEQTARFRAARRHFAKAYELDKHDFRSLYHYARSRSVEPAYPNDNDIAALMEARALAPSVEEISLHAGAALMQRGRKDEAAKMLARLMNSPHGGPEAAMAKAVLEGRTLEDAEKALTEATSGAEGPSQAQPTAPKAK